MESGWSRKSPCDLCTTQLPGTLLTSSSLGVMVLGLVLYAPCWVTPDCPGAPDVMKGSVGSWEGHLRCALTEATKSFLVVGVTTAD